MDNKIKIMEGNGDLLDEIEDLWMELNKHHIEKSVYFKDYYKKLSFKKRKEEFLLKSINGELLCILIKINDNYAGYCVSTVKDNIGEIDSIYTKSEYRWAKIGKILIEKALKWIESKNVEKTIVNVGIGNEVVLDFYYKYGFAPKFTELELI